MMVYLDDNIGHAYMPDLSAVPGLVEPPRKGEDDDYWKVVTSNDHTDGIFNSYVVKVYTNAENHQTLEGEEHITRIDNKENIDLTNFDIDKKYIDNF